MSAIRGNSIGISISIGGMMPDTSSTPPSGVTLMSEGSPSIQLVSEGGVDLIAE